MEKRKINKLKLNKVTISNLNEGQMDKAKGGITITEAQSQCTYNFCYSTRAENPNGMCWGAPGTC